ncbi:hypothetical protein MAMT_02261 [Methylacidimicrobium tartarophylax]|uniref:Transposase n=1 Tax=Methylacidimicrobium tartarophylax TaxID=1041768 RepID=A0A5E6MH07_9BACT|nr:hypothetical protein MAMT_02261 [Methylacidimicrobium tartarophylax]
MSKTDQGQHRARYTLEFKMEAVRLVKAGQEASVTARVLGMPKQTLSNWVRLAEKGELLVLTLVINWKKTSRDQAPSISSPCAWTTGPIKH